MAYSESTGGKKKGNKTTSVSTKSTKKASKNKGGTFIYDKTGTHKGPKRAK